MEKENMKRIIDEIIEKKEQIERLQKEIGIEIFGISNEIVLYGNQAEFFDLADALRCEIYDTGACMEYCARNNRKIYFEYRGITFSVYITAMFIMDNLDLIKEKVLPPSKVTEPIQE